MDPEVIRILLAEDNVADATLLQEALLQADLGRFKVTVADRLDKALKLEQENAFDVILLDLSLPDSAGADTYRRARRAASKTPIVVLTGNANDRIGLQAVREGIQDYLVKGQADGHQIWRTIRYSMERKRREDELRQLNRTLQARNASSQAMMRATDEVSYLEEVCRIVVKDCGHAMVWIGFAEDDPDSTIRPAAYFGFNEGYLETLKLTWADTERGRGPTGTAIRTGKPCACPNMLTNPSFTPWREAALQRGYASSMAFPLSAETKTFGALTIYSKEPDPFSAEEAQLLGELANDLSYGISAIRLRASHARSVEALLQSEMRYRMLVELAPDAIIAHQDGRLVYVNPAALRLYGAEKRAQLLGRKMIDLVHPEDRQAAAGRIKAAMDGSRAGVAELRVLRLSGQIVPVEAVGAAIDFQGQPAVQDIFRDISERKQAEAQLRLHAAALEAAANGIVIADHAGTILWANPAFTRLTGYPVQEAIGQTPRVLKSGRHDAVFYRNMWDTILAGRPWHGEVVNRRKDGSLYTEEMTITPVRAEGNAITHFIAVKEDVTERKRAEEALVDARSAKTSQDMIDAMEEGVVLLDLSGRIRLLNPAMANLLERERAGVVGQDLRDLLRELVFGDDLETIAGAFREVTQGKKPTLPPLTFHPKNGKPIVAVPSIAFVSNPDGSPLHVVCTFRNITELRRAHEAVQASERKYHELVEHANSIIMRRKPDGTIIFFNEFAQQFFGYHENEILGRNVVGTIVPPVDSAGNDLAKMILDIGRNPEKYASNENENVCGNGRRVWVHWTNRALRDPFGDVVELLCVGIDITERKEAERERHRYQERLRSLADKLARTEEEERRRISRYIHDTVIQSLSLSNIKLGAVRETLATSLPEELGKVEMARELVVEAIRECRHLMTDLTPPMLYELGLAPALDALAEQLSKKHGVPIHVEDDGLPKPLANDRRGLLFQCTRELVVNALKHAGPCRITISTYCEGNSIQIDVHDSGVGFDASKFRSRPGAQGGFGLFNLRERIDALGGRFEIHSTPQDGTKASITVPLSAPAVVSTTPPA